MKRKTVFGIIVLLSITLLTGCSFNVKGLAKYNPFSKTTETVNDVDHAADKKEPVKSREEAAAELNVMIVQIVRDINAGFLDKAIAGGEAAYAIAARPEYTTKTTDTTNTTNPTNTTNSTKTTNTNNTKPVSVQPGTPNNPAAAAKKVPAKPAQKGKLASAKTTAAPSVTAAVYDPYGLDATKEKLYEVLIDAYDFKNHLTGLSEDEKANYVRTARAHYNINPSDVFKKNSLARVLLETDNLDEGLKLATEVYNSDKANAEFLESYAWGLYLSGKKGDAYNLYKGLMATMKSGTLTQVYRAATVTEEVDKSAGLSLYKATESAGYNLMVLEPNVNNMSAQSYINKVITDAKNANDRLLAGGIGVDSQFNLQASEKLIQSIVNL